MSGYTFECKKCKTFQGDSGVEDLDKWDCVVCGETHKREEKGA